MKTQEEEFEVVGTIDLTPTDEGYAAMFKLFSKERSDNLDFIRQVKCLIKNPDAMLERWVSNAAQDALRDYEGNDPTDALRALITTKQEANAHFDESIGQIERWLKSQGKEALLR